MTGSPYRITVDDIYEVPAQRLTREVLDGRLVLAPPAGRRHEGVAGQLVERFRRVLPEGAQVRRHEPVRLPGGDGPVPDALVTSAVDWPRGWPATTVHTVVEVVGEDGRHLDRVFKRDEYARAGIPCFWRVELVGRGWLRGPLPLVVVRVRQAHGWRELLVPAGESGPLPVAYGRDRAGAAVTVPVRLDPRALLTGPAADS